MQNAITDVPGVLVGQYERTDEPYLTGTTVVYLPRTAVAGVDVRGGAPGTRETDLLDPVNSNPGVNAIVLTGGSAYGLDAASGVMAWLEERGEGVRVGPDPSEVVPIVPAAVIFDLGRGGLPRATPDPELGAAAYRAARGPGGSAPVPQGSVGAGTGAQAGGLAGGVGSASYRLPDGGTVAALAVVNAAGSPVDPATGELYAARYGLPDEFPLRAPDPDELAAWPPRPGGPLGDLPPGGSPGGAPGGAFNTVIGVVATDATLTKAQCSRLAGAAHDGLARAVRPAHTMTDGDTVFGLATGAVGPPELAGFNTLLEHAADCFTRAIGHAILAATGRDGTASYLETFPSAARRTRC